jgi:acyl transferase domain-containing protein
MIRNGDCDAAIVISSCTHFLPTANIFRDHAGIGSHSGRCATFFQSADGFLPSEGAAAIVIQRSKNARVMPYAKIRAVALGQDGRTQSFAAPNEHAQARTIAKALKKANLCPNDIDYYECKFFTLLYIRY